MLLRAAYRMTVAHRNRAAAGRPQRSGMIPVAALAALPVLAGLAAVPAAGARQPVPADLVLRGGTVWTNTGENATARRASIAIRGERIVAVGSNSWVRRWKGAKTRVVRLNGAFVAPGFRDQHNHLLQTASSGASAEAYRPSFTDFDPAAADASRTSLARRHEGLYEQHLTPVDECTRSPVTEQMKQSILVMQDEAARQGLTSVVEAGLRNLGMIDALRQLEAENKLKLRFLVRVAWGCIEQAAAMGLRTGSGSEWLKILGVKLYADGWLGPRTAALRAPYSSERRYTTGWFPFGIAFLDLERAVRDVARARELGFNVTSHAIGDRGAETVLRAYQGVGVKPSDRYALEHVQVLGDDLFERMATMGVIGSMQLSFATSDQRFAEEAVGPQRLRTSYAWRTMLARGIRLAGGSDFGVEVLAPLWGLQRVITRQEFDGTPPGGWQPEQRLDRLTALRLITSDDAYASFEERERGRIERGRYADLVVTRENLFRLPEDCIAAATVMMTVTNGRIAFEGRQAYPPGRATCQSGAAPAP